MGGITFLTLRMADGAVQCVCDPAALPEGLCDECAVELTGTVREESRAPGGHEIAVETLTVLSRPGGGHARCPSPSGRWTSIWTRSLPSGPAVLRHLKRRAVFKIQEGLVRAFRDYLHSQQFTEIHTPKIVHAGAEGGSNIFKLDYFGKKAYLAQSPQFYKQTMVGVYERVYEVGPVFRAEKHSTTRHLNEYTGLDLEMGYIDSFYDVIEVETGFLKYAMDLLAREYADDLKRLDVELPDVSGIPWPSALTRPSGWRRKSTATGSGIPTIWSRRRKPTSGGTSRRSTAATSCLSPTTRRKSGRFTPWTIWRTRSILCPSTCCSGAWRSPPAASASTATMSRWPRWRSGGWTRRTSKATS